MIRRALVLSCAFALALFPVDAPASGDLTRAQKLSLARNFVAKMKHGYAKADAVPSAASANEDDFSEIADRGYEQGEELIFSAFSKEPERYFFDKPISGRVKGRGLVLSAHDFFDSMGFVIKVDEEKGTAKGWYIRENKNFALDLGARKAESDHGTFGLSPDTGVIDGRIYLAVGDIEKLFDIDLKFEIKSLTMLVKSDVPMPAQEAAMRRARKLNNQRIGPAVLPLAANNAAKITDLPYVDLGESSFYRRDGKTHERDLTHDAYIKTAGDFLKGTLSTYAQGDDKRKLTNVRVNYKQESLDPDLLLGLKARRWEVGDVLSPDIPIVNSVGPQLGFRVTNANPLENSIFPTKRISGEAPPGWDVELYRNESLLAFQTVGDNGIYTFEDVQLFGSDNNLKLILYGPQGEIREENISVPVDTQRLTNAESAYDVAVTLNDAQTYKKRTFHEEGYRQPELAAQFERPIGDSSALTGALMSVLRDGTRTSYLEGGLSTVLGGALLNFDSAVDNNGESEGRLTVRRQYGEHNVRDTTTVRSENFNAQSGGSTGNIFENEFGANGPLAFYKDIFNPQYNLNFLYGLNADGDPGYNATAGYSGRYGRIGMSQQLTYDKESGEDAQRLGLQTALNGSAGPYRLRFTASNEFTPEAGLKSLYASANRSLIGNRLDGQLSLQRTLNTNITQGRAQLNWQAGVATISPAVAYDTHGDIEATLNLRSGAAYDHGFKLYDNAITGAGGVSVFVFLDKNGNNKFDGVDEPVPNALVKTPQSLGGMPTNEKGIALITRLQAMRPTDVFVDPDSLQDPYWVPGYDGASVIPREGSLIEMQFPVHISGEVEGTLSVAHADGGANYPQDANVTLIPIDGVNAKEIQTETESDGYFLLSRVPPGSYLMTVTDFTARDLKAAAPAPIPVFIDYKGAVLSGKNIALKENQRNAAVIVKRVQSGINPGQIVYAMKTRPGAADGGLLDMLRRFTFSKAPPDLFAGLKKLDIRMDTEKNVVYYQAPGGGLNETYDRCQAIAQAGVSCDFIVLINPKKPENMRTAMK